MFPALAVPMLHLGWRAWEGRSARAVSRDGSSAGCGATELGFSLEVIEEAIDE